MPHTKTVQESADEVPRWIVGLDEAENVVSLLGQGQQRLRDGADARAGDQAILTALQLGEQQLQLTRGRIRGARVKESWALASQETLGLRHALELELDRLIDRRHDRMVAGRQLDLGRMIDSRGLFHHSSSVNRSASNCAGNFSLNARSAAPSSVTVVTLGTLPSEATGMPRKSFAALSPA